MKNKIPITIHHSVPIRASRCGRCGKTINRSTGLQERKPRAGDFSVCIGCGQLAVFRADLSLQNANAEELNEFRLNSPDEYELAQKLTRWFEAKRAQRQN